MSNEEETKSEEIETSAPPVDNEGAPLPPPAKSTRRKKAPPAKAKAKATPAKSKPATQKSPSPSLSPTPSKVRDERPKPVDVPEDLPRSVTVGSDLEDDPRFFRIEQDFSANFSRVLERVGRKLEVAEDGAAYLYHKDTVFPASEFRTEANIKKGLSRGMIREVVNTGTEDEPEWTYIEDTEEVEE